MSDLDPESSEARSTLRHLRHEMRTPLGHIIGYSEILEEEVRDRGQEDLVADLEKIRTAAQRLLGIVDDVFSSDPAGSPDTARARAAVPEPTPGEAPVAAGAGSSLLVVDDEPNNRDLLKRRLEGVGYEITTAVDGREALHKIEAGDFDLVLLDVLMPGMSGLEVLEALRRTHSVSELPVVMATALGGSEDIAAALGRGANDYVTKPFDFVVVMARVETQLGLKRAAREIAALARQLEIRNSFIRRAFGRYVSDEIVDNLLEHPEGLVIRGEKRRVSILMTDLRGFSSLTEELSPTQVVSLLNDYLGTMSEIIQDYGGVIDEFIGDAVLAFFGAPIARADDTERAVAAAIAMQLAVDPVNERNRSAGLPDIEMGVGIATGDVIVGNIGSEKRTKYAAVGSPVNLASRIESFTLGGEILVDEATLRAAGEIVRTDEKREVHPKGLPAPISIYRIAGIGGEHDLQLPEHDTELTELDEAIPVRFGILEGKEVAKATLEGAFCALSHTNARLRSPEPLPALGNLRIELLDSAGAALDGGFYAKVVTGSSGGGEALLRFTTRSGSLQELLERILGG